VFLEDVFSSHAAPGYDQGGGSGARMGGAPESDTHHGFRGKPREELRPPQRERYPSGVAVHADGSWSLPRPRRKRMHGGSDDHPPHLEHFLWRIRQTFTIALRPLEEFRTSRRMSSATRPPDVFLTPVAVSSSGSNALQGTTRISCMLPRLERYQCATGDVYPCGNTCASS
jgi:hypothetical protein